MNDQHQIIPVDSGGSELALTSADPESMMRFAIEKGAGVDVMEKMLALHERMTATRAREAYTLAMANFQGECPIIKKVAFGAKNAYKFAPLDFIVVQTRDLIKKHGFIYSLTAEVKGERVKAICKITHTLGHSEISEFECPIDGNRANMMTDPQRFGAAMTFAKRYAFTNAFGILTGDEDTDGRARTRDTAPKFGPQRKLEPETEEPEPEPKAQPRAATPPPASRTAPAAARQPQPHSSSAGSPEKTLRLEIWNSVKDIPTEDWSGKMFPDGAALQTYLWDEGILLDTEELQKLPVDRLNQVLAALRKKFPPI